MTAPPKADNTNHDNTRVEPFGTRGSVRQGLMPRTRLAFISLET